MKRTAVAAIALVGGSVLAPATPAQAQEWRAPQRVSAAGVPVSSAVGALRPDGTASVAMQATVAQGVPFTSIQVADRSLNGAWAAPILLSDRGLDARAPAIGAGSALTCAAWDQEVGPFHQVRVACKANAGWGASQAIGDDFGSITDLDVAVAANGRSVVTALAYSTEMDRQTIIASTLQAGVWSAPQALSSVDAHGGATFTQVDVEARADGSFVAAWSGDGGVASSSLGARSAAFDRVSIRGARPALFEVVVSAGDAATVLWSERDDTGIRTLHYSQYRGLAWTPDRVIDDEWATEAIRPTGEFAAAADPDGSITVAWAEVEPDGSAIGSFVVPSSAAAVVRDGNPIASGPGWMGAPALAADGRGGFHVLFARGRTPFVDQSMQSTYYASPAQRILAGDSHEVEPQQATRLVTQAMLHSGRALLAVWLKATAGGNEVWAASWLDPGTPAPVQAASDRPGSLIVRWGTPRDGALPDGYVVQVRVAGARVWKEVGRTAGNARSLRVNGLVSGRTYEARVAGLLGTIPGDWSLLARAVLR